MNSTTRPVRLARMALAILTLISLFVALHDCVAAEPIKINVKVTSSAPKPNAALTGDEVTAVLTATVDEAALAKDEAKIAETTWAWKEVPKATKGVTVTHDPKKDTKTSSAATLKMKFDDTGEKKITVMVTVTIQGKNQKNEAITWVGNAEVTVVVLISGDLVVNFDKPEVRPGIAEKRWETVKATARRKDKGDAVKIDLASDDARAKVSPAFFNLPAGQTEQTQIVTVMGVKLSTADQDTKHLAKVGAAIIGSLPITVVEPKNWTNNNLGIILEDKTPTAVKVPDAPAKSPFGIHFQIPVAFTFQDQFEKTLRPQWAGVLIFEGIKGETEFSGFDANDPKGTPISDAAMATDPVQFTTPGFLTDEQVKLFNTGKLNLTSPAKIHKDTLIAYKIEDGKTVYILLQSNHRIIKTTLNFASMTDKDAKVP